jgi:twitching motility protein PilT
VCQIDPLLQDAVAQSASDIHLTAEQPPIFRVHGQLVRQGKVAFSAADLETMLLEILPADRREEFQLKGQADFSYAIAGLGRFRVNAYRQRNHVALALRTIPFRIQPLHELGLPEVVAGLCDKPHGLVVVTGPTGSGKSTTLASMVDLINGKYAHHIITLEDPIEFLHRHRLSIINQREIGQDCPSFALGLRAALRQNPNVILIGTWRRLRSPCRPPRRGISSWRRSTRTTLPQRSTGSSTSSRPSSSSRSGFSWAVACRESSPSASSPARTGPAASAPSRR